MTDTFDWVPSKKREFLGLANLLSLRTGGQIKPSPFVDDEAVDPDLLDVLVEEDEQPVGLGSSYDEKIKIKFLDRFAELMVREKDASSVSCAAMLADGHQVNILVSRNEGFGGVDYKFLDDFKEQMVLLTSSRGMCFW